MFLSSKDVRSLLLFSTLTMWVQGKDCSFTQPCSHFTRLKGSAPAFHSVLEEHKGRRGASSCSYRFRSACRHRDMGCPVNEQSTLSWGDMFACNNHQLTPPCGNKGLNSHRFPMSSLAACGPALPQIDMQAQSNWVSSSQWRALPALKNSVFRSESRHGDIGQTVSGWAACLAVPVTASDRSAGTKKSAC